MGSSCENSALGMTRQSVGSRPRSGRFVGRQRRGRRRRAYARSRSGSDTGGSIREPAAFCGIVGFKPTYGRVSRYGLIAFASSLDQIGPMTRTVADAALLYEAMAGNDPLDATSVDRAGRAGLRRVARRLARRPGRHRARVRVWRRSSRRCARSTNAPIATSKRSGAELVEVELPTADYGVATYYLIAPAECSSNLARFDGVRYGLRVERARRRRDVRSDARRRLRRRGQAPHPDRHARALERLLRRVLRARAEGAHADRRRFRRAFAALRCHRVPGRRLPRVRIQRQDRIRTACT